MRKTMVPAVVIILVLLGIIGYLMLNYWQEASVEKELPAPSLVPEEPPVIAPPEENPEEEVVVPPAPGPFDATAVRALSPSVLRTGENEVTAEVRGYMFFEGETRLALYDGTEEVNIGLRPDGFPNTIVAAIGEWMISGYVPVAQTITIPAGLEGKTLVIRFIDNDQRDDARPRYWGTLIKVE